MKPGQTAAEHLQARLDAAAASGRWARTDNRACPWWAYTRTRPTPAEHRARYGRTYTQSVQIRYQLRGLKIIISDLTVHIAPWRPTHYETDAGYTRLDRAIANPDAILDELEKSS